jgi:hypothetical protein
LSDSDTLQTLAEVGVALAGFTGVVFVLGSRATGEWSRVEKLWFHILLSSSAHVVFFALLPAVLESYLSTSTAWRWSAGLLGVGGLVFLADLWRRFWPNRGGFTTLWRRLMLMNFVVGTLQMSSCIVVAAGYLPEFLAFVYLLLLLNFVASALVNFVYLLQSGMTTR